MPCNNYVQKSNVSVCFKRESLLGDGMGIGLAMVTAFFASLVGGIFSPHHLPHFTKLAFSWFRSFLAFCSLNTLPHPKEEWRVVVHRWLSGDLPWPPGVNPQHQSWSHCKERISYHQCNVFFSLKNLFKRDGGQWKVTTHESQNYCSATIHAVRSNPLI